MTELVDQEASQPPSTAPSDPPESAALTTQGPKAPAWARWWYGSQLRRSARLMRRGRGSVRIWYHAAFAVWIWSRLRREDLYPGREMPPGIRIKIELAELFGASGGESDPDRLERWLLSYGLKDIDIDQELTWKGRTPAERCWNPQAEDIARSVLRTLSPFERLGDAFEQWWKIESRRRPALSRVFVWIFTVVCGGLLGLLLTRVFPP